jgi:hypothetical protein
MFFAEHGGSTYEGAWRHGKASGPGTWTKEGVGEYTGEFKGDEMHGEGTFNWKSGAKYQGVWEFGKKSGYGIMIFRDGSKYEGNWLKDNRHGEGTMTW